MKEYQEILYDETAYIVKALASAKHGLAVLQGQRRAQLDNGIKRQYANHHIKIKAKKEEIEEHKTRLRNIEKVKEYIMELLKREN